MRYFWSRANPEASAMNDLDPDRFTLRQAAQARDDFRPGDG